MTKADFLLMLVRSELTGTRINQFDLASDSFKAFMKIANMQTVTGLFCSALMDNEVKLDKLDAIETFATQRNIARQNDKLNNELTSLHQLLSKDSIPFFVVKGQTLNALYPHPGTRVAGDIDFYCDKAYFDKALRLITNQWNPQFGDDDDDGESDQHIGFQHGDCEYEMHFCLMKFASKSNQKYFDQLIRQSPLTTTDVAGTSIPTLQPAINVVYTFLHLYHHLIELGVGLRQFCDLAVLLHHIHQDSNIDWENFTKQVDDILHTLGFRKAFCAVGSILIDKLGLPAEEFPFTVTDKHRKYQCTILEITFKRGNFGKYGRKKAVRSGLGYYIEALGIKLNHYMKLYWLSPKENRAVFLHEIPHKIVKSMYL
jgi:hypothetical protein